MKNMGSLLINKIIHDFKDIATGVKAREQEFVCITFNKAVKQRARKSHTNIGFSDTVFECGLIEKVVNEHLVVSIAHKGAKKNPDGYKGVNK
jgi:hypothetical protein